jgi:hypothetical protein
MKYTVVYSPFADYQLADLWLRAANQQQMTDAANPLDVLLRHDPEKLGKLRPNGWRVLVFPPLVVTFDVSLDDRKETVSSVRLTS